MRQIRPSSLWSPLPLHGCLESVQTCTVVTTGLLSVLRDCRGEPWATGIPNLQRGRGARLLKLQAEEVGLVQVLGLGDLQNLRGTKLVVVSRLTVQRGIESPM